MKQYLYILTLYFDEDKKLTHSVKLYAENGKALQNMIEIFYPYMIAYKIERQEKTREI